MSNELKVGIYIPTLNKPDFVIRQIKYYASLRSPHPIYIGDDSNEENALILQQAIENFKDRLEINYYHKQWPPSQADCELKLVSSIKEKYAVFCGDDDFLTPNSLTKCAEFLEKNSDYALATGLAVSFNLDRSGPYGQIVSMSDYRRPEVLKEKAGERLLDYLTTYHVTLFSVGRTVDLKNDWELSLKAKEGSFQTEIMSGCLAVARGKTKTLDCLAIIRQMHDTRQPSPDIFDWLTKPDWAETYQYFSEVLAKEISEKDDFSEDEAKSIIKKAMWTYIQKHLVAKYGQVDQKKPTNFEKLSKKIVKKIFPSSKKIFLKYLKPRLKTGRPSLHYEVRQPWSPYYQDFQEIVKAVEKKQN